jgi:hypothetical protein
MRSTRQPMKLSPEEELFLRHWIKDEADFQERRGAAKALQLAHGVRPADLALLIAAGMPDLEEQAAAADGPAPADPPSWPWSPEGFEQRLADARVHLRLLPLGSVAPSRV